MARRSYAKQRWSEGGGFYMDRSDHEDDSLSLCDLPLNLIKPRAVETPIAADGDAEFDFGSLLGFSNSAAPEMCLADEVFYQGKILPIRLSVSSDNSSAGIYRRHGSIGNFRSLNSSRSSSSSSVTNNFRVPNLFHSHSHPSPKPQIKASPTTFRQVSTGGRSQKLSSRWDFFRVGVVKAPGIMELQDLKHRSSTRRSDGVKETMERKSEGILGGVGCKCSVESAVAERRRGNGKGNSKSIPAMAVAVAAAMREKAKKREKLALARHRTFEWLKELSHASNSSL